MAHGGDAVAADATGAVVMVRGGLPGERLLIEPRGRRRGVGRGRLLRVVEASPERVEAPCPQVQRCGGCPWMTWTLSAQRERKRRWVAEAAAVASAGPLQVTMVDASLDASDPGAPADAGLGYRRSARLGFHRSGQGVALGYRGAAGHKVVPIEGCAILCPPLQAALVTLREEVAPQLQGEGEIALSLFAGGVSAELRCDRAQPPELYAALRAHVGGALGDANLVIGETRERFGDLPPLGVAYDGSELQLPHHGFLQANAAINTALVREVAGLAETAGKRVLELYAGHGNFSVALAPGAASLLAIEVDPAAVEAGRRNLETRGCTHARFVAGDVAGDAAQRALRGAASRADVVVLDPPRTGAREALPAVLGRRPERIVYVSCDMPTLTRDLAVLAAEGYVADHARAFDMFPHTAHVEAVVRLRRVPHG